MARSATTLDAFSAIAEPKRRQILQTIGEKRMPVTAIVDSLGWPQPMVSKHLAVLREVGLLRVERHSRQKVYEVDPQQLKTIHDWVRQFERMWESHLTNIKLLAESRARFAEEQSQPKKEKP